METLTLYLAPWQKRMMKDFLSATLLKKIRLKDITKIIIRNPKMPCPKSYLTPPFVMRRDDWRLYLTDEQLNIINDKLHLRIPLTSINISKDILEHGDLIFK